MKKTTAISLVLLVGFVVGRVSHQPPVNAQAAPPCAQVPGDINGDGPRDISDAVNLLAFLFGTCANPPCPEPVPSCPPPDATQCQTDLFACQGQLSTVTLERDSLQAQLDAGQAELRYPDCTGAPGRFVDNGNGTVTDTCD